MMNIDKNTNSDHSRNELNLSIILNSINVSNSDSYLNSTSDINEGLNTYTIDESIWDRVKANVKGTFQRGRVNDVQTQERLIGFKKVIDAQLVAKEKELGIDPTKPYSRKNGTGSLSTGFASGSLPKDNEEFIVKLHHNLSSIYSKVNAISYPKSDPAKVTSFIQGLTPLADLEKRKFSKWIVADTSSQNNVFVSVAASYINGLDDFFGSSGLKSGSLENTANAVVNTACDAVINKIRKPKEIILNYLYDQLVHRHVFTSSLDELIPFKAYLSQPDFSDTNLTAVTGKINETLFKLDKNNIFKLNTKSPDNAIVNIGPSKLKSKLVESLLKFQNEISKKPLNEVNVVQLMAKEDQNKFNDYIRDLLFFFKLRSRDELLDNLRVNQNEPYKSTYEYIMRFLRELGDEDDATTTTLAPSGSTSTTTPAPYSGSTSTTTPAPRNRVSTIPLNCNYIKDVISGVMLSLNFKENKGGALEDCTISGDMTQYVQVAYNVKKLETLIMIFNINVGKRGKNINKQIKIDTKLERLTENYLLNKQSINEISIDDTALREAFYPQLLEHIVDVYFRRSNMKKENFRKFVQNCFYNSTDFKDSCDGFLATHITFIKNIVSLNSSNNILHCNPMWAQKFTLVINKRSTHSIPPRIVCDGKNVKTAQTSKEYVQELLKQGPREIVPGEMMTHLKTLTDKETVDISDWEKLFRRFPDFINKSAKEKTKTLKSVKFDNRTILDLIKLLKAPTSEGTKPTIYEWVKKFYEKYNIK